LLHRHLNGMEGIPLFAESGDGIGTDSSIGAKSNVVGG
jgi:hypothetical protein